jgi:hypothetical protein
LRSKELDLDLAMTQVLRWTLMPDDDESAAALDDARQLFSQMRVEVWLEHLMAAAARTRAGRVSTTPEVTDMREPARR